MKTLSQCDFLVIGTGLAGLTYALKVAERGKVVILSKGKSSDTNTWRAQGGIAAVAAPEDSFENHIQDTLSAGAGLCHKDIVRMVVEEAPDRIRDLQNWGVKFDLAEDQKSPALGREGGHHQRRILHVADHTGEAIGQALLAAALKHPNIEIRNQHFAIDLLTNKKIEPWSVAPTECLGAYVLDAAGDKIYSLMARFTVLATGGAGKVYLYTSNWEGATGDGIAMAYRAGARVANLEFMQFHPTCLYHPAARTFLITEAMRGEGGELVDAQGHPFMKKYHPMGSLAPRDIVARSIDAEMKRSGADSVFLDMTHKSAEFLKSHFPVIYKQCLSLGIDISQQPIPVVPAAHYLCGGVLTDRDGRTDLARLFAIGEVACTGLHGANRLASNSLQECVVFGHNAARQSLQDFDATPIPQVTAPTWVSTQAHDSDEMIVISHMWDEVRRLMWNYVGIVRSNKRLERAQQRLLNLVQEVKNYYWDFKVHPDILELRNITLVAHLSVECALRRKESVGIHFNIDCPQAGESIQDTILAPS